MSLTLDPLPFAKLVGAGNDFIFVQAEHFQPTPESIVRLCDRRFGIGADGLVLLKSLSPGELKWDFFNSDGSTAQMCGNAARCVVRYAENTWGWSQCRLLTEIGWVDGKVVDRLETVVSWAQRPNQPRQCHIPLANGSPVEGYSINTGVPHLVIDESVYALDEQACRGLQEHVAFQPEGTNVTLYRRDGAGVKTRTFERGVRDFTLACGTGVLATAQLLRFLGDRLPMTLTAPGGQLVVSEVPSGLSLRGPAICVFDGRVHLGG